MHLQGGCSSPKNIKKLALALDEALEPNQTKNIKKTTTNQ